jgi:hypothetical protein
MGFIAAVGFRLSMECMQMKDGSYWINDKTRYGWEVVMVKGDKFYRYGVKDPFDVSEFLLNGMEFLPIEPPEAT